MASVFVTALDPDFSGNRVDVFDTAGGLIGSALFAGDGRPGVFTTSTVTLTGAGIARVVLVPAPADYVAYNGLSFTPSNTPLKLQAVDPYPALIGSDGVRSDPERRAVEGNEVTKAAADGATLLLLRASGLQPGQVVFSVDGGNTGHDGGVSVDGSQRLASVTVPVVQTSQGMEAFAFYWVPDDLDPALLTQSVPLTARLVPASGTPSEKSLTITLVRPPVVLVHGIWSKAATWANFPLRTSPNFQVTVVDYSGTHASHFATNQVLVHRFADQALFKLRAQGVAVTRVDYVAHSMGGILGRLHTQLHSYRNPLNFSRGDLHKLLTLNTPHTGTPVANEALKIMQRYPRFTSILALPRIDMAIDQGAVEDLATGSTALAGILATPVPAHALVGTGGTAYNDRLTKIPDLGWLYLLFKILRLNTDFFVGKEHDGLVPAVSQQGGLPSFTTFSGDGSLHTKVTSNGNYSGSVGLALTKLVSDPVFNQFPPSASVGFVASSARPALREAGRSARRRARRPR